MLRRVDSLANFTTMYRLVLYGVFAISVIAVILGFAGVLPFGGLVLLDSVVLSLLVCVATNTLISKLLRVPANPESSYITAFILFLIMSPATTLFDAQVLAIACVIAMASKYVLAIRKKHIFNPAAIGALLAGLLMGSGAMWWVATPTLLPVVAIVAILVVRKLHRWPLVIACIVAAAGMIQPQTFSEFFFSWPIVFFAGIMLTEPLTAPTTERWQIVYGVIAGILFGSSFHLGPIYASPEFALVVANLFAYIVSPKQRLRLTLKERSQVARNIYHLSFTPDAPLAFQPGQYLEWTLPHAKPDVHGIRRSFTITSAPEDPTIDIGVRIMPDGSSFKRALLALPIGGTVYASQLSGDFTLPKNRDEKLAFIAGGIGVTPFRSMVRRLMAANERRDITLLYACKGEEEFAFRDELDEAEKKIGLNVIRLIVDRTQTEEVLTKNIPDFADRIFYISGPPGMVAAYKRMLKKIGVPSRRIKTDYFSGY